MERLILKIFVFVALLLTSTHSFSEPREFDINDLIGLLGRVGTIEAALPNIPQDDVRFFSLVYATRSTRQFASPELPRVIMANDNLLFAFTGNDRVDGGKNVEAIQFNKTTGAFDFYNLDTTGSEVKVVKNPSSCTSCHAGRPIWDTYPFWPGFFGSTQKPLPQSDVELTNLAQLVGDLSERYKTLGLGGGAEETYRVLEGNNASIGHILSQNNFDEIVSRLTQSSQFDRFKFALAASLFDGVSSDDLIELIDPTSKEHLRQVYRETVTQVETQFHKYINSRAEYHSQLSGLSVNQILEVRRPYQTSLAAADLQDFAKFVFVTKLMGIENVKWAMVFGKGMLGFSDGGSNLGYLSGQLFDALVKSTNLGDEVGRQRIFKFSGELRVFPPGTNQNSWIGSKDKTTPLRLSNFQALKISVGRTCSELLLEKPIAKRKAGQKPD